MFTVARLGIDGRLAKTLTTSNPVESMISIARTTNRNVTRWRDGQMVLQPSTATPTPPPPPSPRKLSSPSPRVHRGSSPKFHTTRDMLDPNMEGRVVGWLLFIAVEYLLDVQLPTG